MRHLITPITLIISLSSGCASARTVTGRGDKCRRFETDKETVYSVEARARILNRGGTIGGMATREVVTKMDQASEDWVRMRETLCDDERHGKISQELYSARSGCLDAWLMSFRNLVTHLENGADPGKQLADQLASASECLTRNKPGEDMAQANHDPQTPASSTAPPQSASETHTTIEQGGSTAGHETNIQSNIQGNDTPTTITTTGSVEFNQFNGPQQPEDHPTSSSKSSDPPLNISRYQYFGITSAIVAGIGFGLGVSATAWRLNHKKFADSISDDIKSIEDKTKRSQAISDFNQHAPLGSRRPKVLEWVGYTSTVAFAATSIALLAHYSHKKKKSDKHSVSLTPYLNPEGAHVQLSGKF